MGINVIAETRARSEGKKPDSRVLEATRSDAGRGDRDLQAGLDSVGRASQHPVGGVGDRHRHQEGLHPRHTVQRKLLRGGGGFDRHTAG